MTTIKRNYVTASLHWRGIVKALNAGLRLYILPVFLLLTGVFQLQAQAPGNAFVTTWKGSSITIPTAGTGYNYDVYWEEVGNTSNNGSSSGNTGNKTINFGGDGTYRVYISGDFPRIYFNNEGDKDKILSVEQWGNISWKSMANAFYGASNLTLNAKDKPDLSGVRDMSRMFQHATSFNQYIGDWDVSKVTNMACMFSGAETFNQDIGNWKVGNVTNMECMFSMASSFNQDIGNWNVAKVIEMNEMFNEAIAFNQNIGNWNVGSVTNMDDMFAEAESFNQDISNWDVDQVTSMRYMFVGAKAFNQNIGNWDVSNVTEMECMFTGADAFNQDISGWNVSKVTDMEGMFRGADAFNQDISGWDMGSVTDMSGMFQYAKNFNQDIGNWDVGNVELMNEVFYGAMAFNQDISHWNITKVTNMDAMFSGITAFDAARYSAILDGWAALGDAMPSNLALGTIGSITNPTDYYSTVKSARDVLIDKGWTMTDGGPVTGYKLTYRANNASISGDTVQYIRAGTNGTRIYVKPDTGYQFLKWSDGSTDNPRTDKIVKADIEVTAVMESLRITGFVLVDASTDEDIREITDGDVIYLSESKINSYSLNIRANATNIVSSVRFQLSGKHRHTATENQLPYALYSDQSGDYFGRSLAFGSYTLTATPYQYDYLKGDKGTSMTISFEVKKESAQTLSK